MIFVPYANLFESQSKRLNVLWFAEYGFPSVTSKTKVIVKLIGPRHGVERLKAHSASLEQLRCPFNLGCGAPVGFERIRRYAFKAEP
jgi:hypothetical protein